MTSEEATNTVEETAKMYGLKYRAFSQKDKNNWYGTAGPYFNFMCGFHLRLKELRIGHSNMTVTKTGEATKQFLVEKHGLDWRSHKTVSRREIWS